MTNNNKGIYGISEGEFFAKLPNKIVWTLEGVNTMSLRKELNFPFTVSALYVLYENCNLMGYSMFSINNLIERCGYKTNNKNVALFREFLLQLQFLDMIEPNVDLETVKANDFIMAKLNLKIDTEYFIIYHNQYSTIFNSDYDTSTKNNVFTFLCYILSRIKTLKVGENGADSEYCFFNYERAIKDLGISKPTLVKCTKIAKELGLIYSDNVGKIKKDNRQCSNVYALTEKGLDFGLKQSYEYYNCEYVDNFIPKEQYKKKYGV